MQDALHWVEEHPALAAVIGVGGVFILLWLLGFFSSTKSSDSGSSNLASAYYAAEAAQAKIGGDIQLASITTAAQTRQNADNANAAVAIANTQAGAAVTINGQNASAATAINAQNTWRDVSSATLGTWLGSIQASDQLLATQSNDAASVATTTSNNATAYNEQVSHDQTWGFANYVNNILAHEVQ
jgi:hypothetical protein